MIDVLGRKVLQITVDPSEEEQTVTLTSELNSVSGIVHGIELIINPVQSPCVTILIKVATYHHILSGLTKRTNPIWICISFGDTTFAIFP